MLQFVLCLPLKHLIFQTSAIQLLHSVCAPAGLIPLLIYPFVLTLSLLRGAEQMGMHKAVKPQFGGGMRRFSCEEDNIYENIESELCFFTSQVRGRSCGPLGRWYKMYKVLAAAARGSILTCSPTLHVVHSLSPISSLSYIWYYIGRKSPRNDLRKSKLQ